MSVNKFEFKFYSVNKLAWVQSSNKRGASADACVNNFMIHLIDNVYVVIDHGLVSVGCDHGGGSNAGTVKFEAGYA